MTDQESVNQDEWLSEDTVTAIVHCSQAATDIKAKREIMRRALRVMGQDQGVKATFLAWQRNEKGERLFPLFNIVGNHPKAGSTVGEMTLVTLGIPVPVYA